MRPLKWPNKMKTVADMLRREGCRTTAAYAGDWLMRYLRLRRYPALNEARAAAAQAYPAWLQAQRPDEAERRRQHDAAFSHRLSFLIPTYNTEPGLLTALVDSLLAQTVDGWEACFYDGCSTRADTRRALAEAAARDPRIRVELGKENLGISGNTNRALAMARYDWVALVDHDDLITEDAAYCVLRAAENGADMVYSDEDKCDAEAKRFFDPHMKADFAPDTLRSGNYICHLMAMEKALMVRVGGLRGAFDGSQDHDLALRASEQARRIVHIPRILYHWRMLDTSVSHQAAERCADAAMRAVADQLRRQDVKGRAYTRLLQTRVAYETDPTARVTLIAACRGEDTQRWLNTLARRTRAEVAEVLLVGAAQGCRFRGKPCRSLPAEGSLSAALNAAAQVASGDYLLFVDQGAEPLDKGWLTELMMFAQRPDVACAGAALLTRQKTYLHCGYAVDVPGGALSHQAGVNYYSLPYMLTDRLNRNVTAVSRGLMMIRRETFLALGGFGAFESDLMAVALGLCAMEAGLLNVYVTDARALWEGKTPPCLTAPAPAEELRRFRAAFGEHPKERYYSPLMEKEKGWMLPDTTRPAPLE